MALTNRDITIKGRLSYAHLFTPHAINQETDPKYSVTILIPKNDPQIQAINTAINNAVQDTVERGKFKQAIDPAATKYPPLRDGDSLTDSGEQRGEEFAGHYFIAAKASTKRKPFIVDGNMNPIIDESEVYSGCYANVAIQFYGYATSGNKGISASLIGVQKVADGEPLGGPATEAEDVFTAIGNTPPTNTNNLGF
ncbi:DUF2815 family protein [Corynebacterium macclintockiae]|uniref:DUF2815 family protein n=1 Tax=Corynebacterium macclintockiae TaxID=2913501 RepID=UPI003EBD2B05